MAWIELHQTIAAHPKTRRLARSLGVTIPTAVGHLGLLWCWALEYAQTGDLSNLEAYEVAEAAMWEGEPKAFVVALVAAGFLDSNEYGLHVHNWRDYAGRLVSKREANAQRMRDARAKVVQRTCDARVTHVHEMCEATVPYRTVPNHVHVESGTETAAPIGAVADATVGVVPFEDGTANEPLSSSEVCDLLGEPAPEAVAEGVTNNIPRAAARPRLDVADAFAAFWAAYPGPRRVDKSTALKRYQAAVKSGVTPADILAGLGRWKASQDWAKEDGAYICGPAVWLGKRRWDDYPAAVTGCVVPIATASTAPREQYLAWAHRLTASVTAHDYKLEQLVKRAHAVNGITVDLEAALAVLASDGLDEAFVWVQRQVSAGKSMTRGAANG